MVSPFERVARHAETAAKLPADNWLQRRKDGMMAHGSAIRETLEAVVRMGRVVLDGSISTDLIHSVETNLETTSPSTELARVEVGILPTTRASRRYGKGGVFTPDAALGVALFMDDTYSFDNPAHRPQPLGKVSLTIYARSWGHLSAEDIESISPIHGTWARYCDNGFERWGTQAAMQLRPGDTLTRDEAETFLAPFAGHILNYFDIMRLPNPGAAQPAGNFSDRHRARQTDTTATQLPPDLRAIGSFLTN